jgi:hypothetical protein
MNEVARSLELSESAAYALMHRLGAVRIGGSLRLERERWNAYLDALRAAPGPAVDANDARQRNTMLPPPGHTAANRRPIHRASAPKRRGSPELQRLLEKVSRPSPPPTKRQLERLAEAEAQEAIDRARWAKIVEKASMPSPPPRKKKS